MSKLTLTHSNIIKLLGIESLPVDQRQEILMSATELVEARMLARVLGMLSDEQKAKFGELLESGDVDQIQRFFEENNIDYLAWVEEETDKVKHELLEEAKI